MITTPSAGRTGAGSRSPTRAISPPPTRAAASRRRPAWARTSTTGKRYCCWSGPTASPARPGRPHRSARPPRRSAAPRLLFLAGRPLPEVPWLSRDFLRQYSSEKPATWDLLDDDDAWQHPVVIQTFPAGLRDGVRLVHAHRERLYQISESLPRTLCHLDFWPKNLIRRPDGQIALIDWSFTGLGAVGEDAGNLVPDSVLDHFIAARDLPRLEQVVFDGYLRGLRQAGWREDPRLVQLGMWSSAVKYDWLAAVTLEQVRQPRQYRYGGGGEIDATFRFAERSRVLEFNARWARQAVELAGQLGR